MSYIFETENRNYEDFASGRVFYNQPGATSFPVRLASEIFQRCEHILKKSGVKSPYSIYDPCCGGAYLLATIGFLHGDRISCILASDTDESMVTLARRNLLLLSSSGIEQRIEQIKNMIDDFGKSSHVEALQSAIKLKGTLLAKGVNVETVCFVADATKEKHAEVKVDIVITDLPYGKVVKWNGEQDEDCAVRNLLDNLIPFVAKDSVIAIVSNKKTSLKHEAFKRVEKFKIGKRQVTFLQLVY